VLNALDALLELLSLVLPPADLHLIQSISLPAGIPLESLLSKKSPLVRLPLQAAELLAAGSYGCLVVG
jgi:hypothetical protein